MYTAGTPTSLGAADARFNLARGYDGKTGVLGLMQLDGKYDAALASYRAWYPDHGGNLLVDAARDAYTAMPWEPRPTAASRSTGPAAWRAIPAR